MRDTREVSGRPAAPRVEFTPPVEGGRSREVPRPGHRHSRSREREGRPFQERLNAAVVDVAVHRVVAYTDLVDSQFGGHPYSARRGIDRLTRAGLLQERTVAGPKGGSYKVLVATRGAPGSPKSSPKNMASAPHRRRGPGSAGRRTSPMTSRSTGR